MCNALLSSFLQIHRKYHVNFEKFALFRVFTQISKMPKRRKSSSSDSESELDLSDTEDDFFIPDPENSGCSDDGNSNCSDNESESELDDDKEFNFFLEKNSYSKISKTYNENNKKLENGHVYGWIDGEQVYQKKIENEIVMSDANIKKIKNMSPVQLFETFFSDDIKNYIIECTNLNGYNLTLSELNTFIGILIFSAYNSRKSQSTTGLMTLI